jgi:REP element-mobilizing transposase RayT
MNYNPQNHHRRSIRLNEYDYSQPGWYYITICTDNKISLFGQISNGKMILNEYGKIVEEEWLKTKKIRKNVDLDYYCIMPNHIHGIIIIEYQIQNTGGRDPVHVGATRRVAPTLQPDSLGSIIGQFKSVSTKQINKINITTGKSIWQRNYYEHIIRNETDLYYIRNYIQNNPLKWEMDELYQNK